MYVCMRPPFCKQYINIFIEGNLKVAKLQHVVQQRYQRDTCARVTDRTRNSVFFNIALLRDGWKVGSVARAVLKNRTRLWREAHCARTRRDLLGKFLDVAGAGNSRCCTWHAVAKTLAGVVDLKRVGSSLSCDVADTAFLPWTMMQEAQTGRYVERAPFSCSRYPDLLHIIPHGKTSYASAPTFYFRHLSWASSSSERSGTETARELSTCHFGRKSRTELRFDRLEVSCLKEVLQIDTGTDREKEG